MSHGRTVCICGKVLLSCRCPGPHQDKVTGPCVCCLVSEPGSFGEFLSLPNAEKLQLVAPKPQVLAIEAEVSRRQEAEIASLKASIAKKNEALGHILIGCQVVSCSRGNHCHTCSRAKEALG